MGRDFPMTLTRTVFLQGRGSLVKSNCANSDKCCGKVFTDGSPHIVLGARDVIEVVGRNLYPKKSQNIRQPIGNTASIIRACGDL